ncbi:hypothetical protein B5G10_08140 [Barnesiella sp. An55]|nr:hypothetical protein B5G10_08140 [Barnesiella sp. An55]
MSRGSFYYGPTEAGKSVFSRMMGQGIRLLFLRDGGEEGQKSRASLAFAFDLHYLCLVKTGEV